MNQVRVKKIKNYIYKPQFDKSGQHPFDRWLRTFPLNTYTTKLSRVRLSMKYLGIETIEEFYEQFKDDPEHYVKRLKETFIDNPGQHAETTRYQTIVDLSSLATFLYERTSELRDEAGNKTARPLIRLRSTARAERKDFGAVLTLEEVSRIERYIEGMPTPLKERDALWFRLMYHMALRLDEVLKLRFCDYVPVPEGQDGRIAAEHGWLRVRTKGGGGEREAVPVHPYVLQAWHRYKNVYFAIVEGDDQAYISASATQLNNAYYKAVKGGDDAARYCPSHFGHGLSCVSPQTLRTEVNQWGEWIGFVKKTKEGGSKPLNPHDLRRNAITHLLDRGFKVENVAAFSRHSCEYITEMYDQKRAKRALKCADALAVGCYQ